MRPYSARYYDAYFVGLDGDIQFYVDRARSVQGPVLEVGAGTGRILLPLAAGGVQVVGVEPDPELRALVQRRLTQAPAAVRRRVRLVDGLVQEMDLGQTVSAALIPYRAFQHLLTPIDQAQALERLHDHLEPGGLLVMDTYDPLDDMLRDGLVVPLRVDTDFLDPESGRQVSVWYGRRVDPLLQLLEQDFVFEEFDGDGCSCRRTLNQLVLRYTPRHEMEYLLELCGFVVEELHGDFAGGAYRGFGNQIWIVRRD